MKISQSKDGVCKLEIAEVFPENEGVISAVAVNRAGEDETACNLAIESYVYEPDSEIGIVSEVGDDIESEEEVIEEEGEDLLPSDSGIPTHIYIPFMKDLLTNVYDFLPFLFKALYVRTLFNIRYPPFLFHVLCFI